MRKVHGRRSNEDAVSGRRAALIVCSRLQRRQVCQVDVASGSIEVNINDSRSVAGRVGHGRLNVVTGTAIATVGML